MVNGWAVDIPCKFSIIISIEEMQGMMKQDANSFSDPLLASKNAEAHFNHISKNNNTSLDPSFPHTVTFFGKIVIIFTSY